MLEQAQALVQVWALVPVQVLVWSDVSTYGMIRETYLPEAVGATDDA